MLKSCTLFSAVLLLLVSHSSVADQEQIRLLKAVVLEQNLYLMSNHGELAIAELETDRVYTVKVPSNDVLEIPLYWDITKEHLYLSHAWRPAGQTTVRILKIPLSAIIQSSNSRNLSDISKLPLSSFALIPAGPFTNALATSKLALKKPYPFFADIHVVGSGPLKAWISQGNVLREWSSPATGGLGIVTQQKERILRINIDVPFIAFPSERGVNLVTARGRRYHLLDQDFKPLPQVVIQGEEPSSTGHGTQDKEVLVSSDASIISLVNKGRSGQSWVQFVVRNDVAQVLKSNQGVDEIDSRLKVIANALKRALKSLQRVEWQVMSTQKRTTADLPKKNDGTVQENYIVSNTNQTHQEIIFRKPPAVERAEGEGLVIKRERIVPTKQELENLPLDTQVLLPKQSYRYWADESLWPENPEEALGWLSFSSLWSLRVDEFDAERSFDLKIFDAFHEPLGEKGEIPGVFVVVYQQGKALFATVTRPDEQGLRQSMPLQDARLLSDLGPERIKAAKLKGSAIKGALIVQVEKNSGETYRFLLKNQQWVKQ